MLLTRAGAPGLREALADAIDRLGGEERIVQEVAETQTVVGLVAAGVGVSLVPESVRALVRAGRHLPPAGRRGAEGPAHDGLARRGRLSRCWPRSWRWRARRPPPKEREVDGGRRDIDVTSATGRRDMSGTDARWGATKSS